MGLSGASLLIGLDKARAISAERRSNPMYELFYTDLDTTHKTLKEILYQTRLAEINWHAEVEKSSGLITRGRAIYSKYRELVMEQLPGASLVDWETSNVTPSEVEVAIEKCINLLEIHTDTLQFSVPALQELHAIANELNIELANDRQCYRIYHQSVDKKDEIIGSATAQFYRVRRFIRRDLGNASPEYVQLRDRAVAAAKDGPVPPVVPPVVQPVVQPHAADVPVSK